MLVNEGSQNLLFGDYTFVQPEPADRLAGLNDLNKWPLGPSLPNLLNPKYEIVINEAITLPGNAGFSMP